MKASFEIVSFVFHLRNLAIRITFSKEVNYKNNPAVIHLFKARNKNTRKVLENFSELTIKTKSSKFTTLLQKRLLRRCFSVNFAKALRKPPLCASVVCLR